MDTTTPTVSATSIAAAAAAASARADDNATQGDAFALLLKSMGQRFQTGALAMDATVIQTAPQATDPKPTDPRDDQASARDDKKADAAADASKDSDTAANDKADTKAANATTAANTAKSAADAQTQVDATQAAQLAAIQAQLLANTAAPTTQVQQVQTVVAQVTPTVATPQVATVDPNAQAVVQTPVTQQQVNPVAQLIAAQTGNAQLAQTVQTVAAAVQQTAQNTTETVATPTLTPTTPVAKADPNAAGPTQDSVQDQTPILPQANQVRAAASQQTPTAKAQSDALSRLLGGDNQIRVAVAVDAQKAATPSISTYNHFIGYSLAENAGASLANGGETQASLAQLDQGASDEALPTVSTLAPLSTLAPTPTTSTGNSTAASAAAEIETAAVSEVSESADTTGAQADAGQAGLGQAQGGPGGTNQTNASTATQTTKPTVTPSQIFDQIKVQITRATKAGNDQVTIQLRPEDLGRVDVKLDVTQDGKVHAHIIADKPETLQLMQSDARGLEKALNDAGLRTDSNALEFSLRGDPGTQSGGNAQNGGTNGGGDSQDAATASLDDPTYDYSQAASARGGVDTYV